MTEMRTAPPCQFTIKYESDEHSLGASTLITSLFSFVAILEEANRALSPGKQLHVSVNATQEGSFELALEMAQTVVDAIKGSLFNSPVTGPDGLLATFKTCLDIRKLLGHKRPEAPGMPDAPVTIPGPSGINIQVTANAVNIYNNPRVSEAMDTAFGALQQDDNVTGLGILNKASEPLFHASRDEFPDMIAGNPNDLKRIVSRPAELRIIKPSFEPKLKWSFAYQGHTINAGMKDPEFQKSVLAGKQGFHAEYTLVVEMTVAQELDTKTGDYIDHSYEIVKVLGVIPGGGKQLVLANTESSETQTLHRFDGSEEAPSAAETKEAVTSRCNEN